jgi:hypothetical protein
MRHPVDQGGVAVAFGAGRLADDPVVFIDDLKIIGFSGHSAIRV